MARHDVFLRDDGPGYLLDLQANLLDSLNTRLVVPLLPVEMAPQPIPRLNPVFSIEGRSVVMATHLMGVVSLSILKLRVCNLRERHDEIVAALDMVFQGF